MNTETKPDRISGNFTPAEHFAMHGNLPDKTIKYLIARADDAYDAEQAIFSAYDALDTLGQGSTPTDVLEAVREAKNALAEYLEDQA